MRLVGCWLLLFLALGLLPVVSGHVSGRGFILLLPTNLFIAGGAAVVLASFALLALIPVRHVLSAAGLGRRLFAVGGGWLAWLSVASLAFTLFLILTGWYGPRDPLRNPAPLFVWSIWWPGTTIVTALLGNVWAVLNPWTGIYRIAMGRRTQPLMRYPTKIGHTPAVIFFLAFAWIELIHPSPADPQFLASLITGYLSLNMIGVFLFGEEAWMRYCEAFSVFFRMVSWISPVYVIERRAPAAAPDGGGRSEALGDPVRTREVFITIPTSKLTQAPVRDLTHIIFVGLALSTVSFDGFSRTFTWLSLIGVNPLEYPGRTVLMLSNTAGLLAVFTAIMAAYTMASVSARLLAFRDRGLGEVMALFIPTIVPIALGYHIAHYFPYVIADLQTTYNAFSDPLGLGWNLLAVSGPPVIPSFLKDPIQIQYVYYVQVGLIVMVHVTSVYIGHVISVGKLKNIRQAMLSQAPLTLLMVGYTMLGLWLLSSPSID